MKAGRNQKRGFNSSKVESRDNNNEFGFATNDQSAFFESIVSQIKN